MTPFLLLLFAAAWMFLAPLIMLKVIVPICAVLFGSRDLLEIQDHQAEKTVSLVQLNQGKIMQFIWPFSNHAMRVDTIVGVGYQEEYSKTMSGVESKYQFYVERIGESGHIEKVYSEPKSTKKEALEICQRILREIHSAYYPASESDSETEDKTSNSDG